jgi:hypothetical protein
VTATKELETEACEEAITDCVYAWKSHQQHEKQVKEIEKFSGIFFGSVSSKIEGLNLDFYYSMERTESRTIGSTGAKICPAGPLEVLTISFGNLSFSGPSNERYVAHCRVGKFAPHKKRAPSASPHIW